MNQHQKQQTYHQCLSKLEGQLSRESDQIVKMASMVAVLHQCFESFYWTGFYRLIDHELVIGPYQGTPACIRIPIGKGVCGTVAQTGLTEVVPYVHDFPGHIACDAASESEIVIPVRNSTTGKLIAVLDIDSTSRNNFDETDAEYLEKITELYF